MSVFNKKTPRPGLNIKKPSASRPASMSSRQQCSALEGPVGTSGMRFQAPSAEDRSAVLRNLIQDFVELADVSKKYKHAEKTLQEHQRSLAGYQASDKADAHAAQIAAMQDMIELVQEQRNCFADQELTVEARLLDTTSKISAGMDALDELVHQRAQDGETPVITAKTVREPPSDPPSAVSDDHWTKATRQQFIAGNYPPTAPGWLTRELSDLRSQVKGTKDANDRLQNELKAARAEIEQLKRENSRRPLGRSVYAATPASGSHGSHTQYGQWAADNGDNKTPLVRPHSSGGDGGDWGSGGSSTWAADPPASSTDSWDVPASATGQASADAPWAPSEPVASTSNGDAASASTSDGAVVAAADKPPHDPKNPSRRPTQPGVSRQSSKKRSQPPVKKVQNIDLVALDSAGGFGEHEGQLAGIRDIAQKVSLYEIENFQNSYNAPAHERRKHQIEELNFKFSDLRARTLTIEDHLHIPHPTDPGLGPHDGQQLSRSRSHRHRSSSQQRSPPPAPGSNPPPRPAHDDVEMHDASAAASANGTAADSGAGHNFGAAEGWSNGGGSSKW